MLLHIVHACWHTLLEMAPYLLLGFFISGLLSVWLSPETVERHLGRGRWGPVVKASLFGVPLPLCSCSVIPVAASLRRHGAGRAATASFLISTPQTGVDSIFVTYSLLGLPFAIFRTLTAFVSGLLGGGVVGAFEARAEKPTAGPLEAPGGHGRLLPVLPGTASCCAKSALEPVVSGTIPSLVTPACGCGEPVPEPVAESCGCAAPTRAPAWRRALYHGFITLPKDLAAPLLTGLLAAGLVAAFVPADYFASSLGTGLGAKILMLLIGIPVYVCATATVPIAAALIGAGISPGAALVFLMAGPATNAATLTTIWKLLGRMSATLYLVMVGLTALGAGILLDLIDIPVELAVSPSTGEHGHPGQWIAAVALLGILLRARFYRRKATRCPASDGR